MRHRSASQPQSILPIVLIFVEYRVCEGWKFVCAPFRVFRPSDPRGMKIGAFFGFWKVARRV